MCGRYATSKSSLDLAALFGATDDVEGLEPDYNVAPTDPVPVVRITSASRHLNIARWGLLPHWAKDPSVGNQMINAAHLHSFGMNMDGHACTASVEFIRVTGDGNLFRLRDDVASREIRHSGRRSVCGDYCP